VIRAPALEFSRWGKRALRAGGDDVVAAPVRGWRRRVRDTARAALYFPDAQVGWYGPALAKGLQAKRGCPVDLVLSTSFPITAHMIARRLAAAHGVPWVADFRDSWSAMLEVKGEPAWRARRFEQKLVDRADAVITVSPALAALQAKRWGRPVDVVMNGHDMDGLQPTGVQRIPKTLGYLGSFYPDSQDVSVVSRHRPAASRATRRAHRPRGPLRGDGVPRAPRRRTGAALGRGAARTRRDGGQRPPPGAGRRKGLRMPHHRLPDPVRGRPRFRPHARPRRRAGLSSHPDRGPRGCGAGPARVRRGHASARRGPILPARLWSGPRKHSRPGRGRGELTLSRSRGAGTARA
jgi:glycosyltransferase involved in cell wall biosynthesis